VSPFDEPVTIETERLLLTPLRAEDADVMVAVLADDRLHAFVGGRPSGLEELRARYSRFIAGPSDPCEVWLNGIVRRRTDAGPIGTTQATLTDRDGRWAAHVAWVIGTAWQRRGFGSEVARALVAWLRRRGASEVVALVHPEHRASELVATRAELRVTDDVVDGERVWRLPDGG
jgi:RimJ/RimL family protein N-acetyltransferase